MAKIIADVSCVKFSKGFSDIALTEDVAINASGQKISERQLEGMHVQV